MDMIFDQRVRWQGAARDLLQILVRLLSSSEMVFAMNLFRWILLYDVNQDN